MASEGLYLEESLSNHIFRNTAFIQPSTIVVALCISPVVNTDTGALTGKEVTGAGYSRATVGRGDAFWTDNGNGSVSNANNIAFTMATGDWTGPIGYVAFVDDAIIGAGNVLFFGTLDA